MGTNYPGIWLVTILNFKFDNNAAHNFVNSAELNATS